MQISMSMVEHWLREYQPVSTIQSRTATILGIRHLNNNQDPDPNFIYVGRIKDLSLDSDSANVVLVHRKDVITLQTNEMEMVFDLLMDVLVFYQDWERKLVEALQQENPEQSLIDACEDIFGPIFFINMQLKMSAFSGSCPKEVLEDCWNRFWQWDGGKALRSTAGKRESFLQIFHQIWDRRPFYGTSGEEYPYSLVISQVAEGKQLTGQMILLSAKPFETYQLELAEVLQRYLCLAANPLAGRNASSVIYQMFLSLLHGENETQEARQMLCHFKNWQEEDPFLPFVIRRAAGQILPLTAQLPLLEQAVPEAIYVMDELPVEGNTETVIAGCLPVPEVDLQALSAADAEIRLRSLFRYCTENHLSVHVGYFGLGLQKLKWQYRQARIAACLGERYFFFCALSVLASFTCEPELCRLSLHPAPRQIQEYDAEHGTDFFSILRTYLRCERNRAEAARELFVHKNTLAYRLERMEEIFHLHLDNAYEREYLMITIRNLESRALSFV